MNVHMRVHVLRTDSSTRSHPSEEENRITNCSENCKCKRALNVDYQLYFLNIQGRSNRRGGGLGGGGGRCSPPIIC